MYCITRRHTHTHLYIFCRWKVAVSCSIANTIIWFIPNHFLIFASNFSIFALFIRAFLSKILQSMWRHSRWKWVLYVITAVLVSFLENFLLFPLCSSLEQERRMLFLSAMSLSNCWKLRKYNFPFSTTNLNKKNCRTHWRKWNRKVCRNLTKQCNAIQPKSNANATNGINSSTIHH